MKEIKTSIGLFIATCLLMYGVIVCYWLLYPYNVIDVHSITVQNKNKIVPQGGVLIYELRYTKYLDIAGVVHRQLVNTYTISYSDMPAIAPIGSRTTLTHLPVPAYASPGKYRLRWWVEHPVNPMRYVPESAWSDVFEIVPAAEVEIEKGEKGDQGEQGEQGIPGPQGVPGKRGSGFWPSSTDHVSPGSVPVPGG